MSKLEELIKGYCPNGVEYKPLGETIEIQRGTRVVKNQLTANGLFPVYQNSLTPMGYHTESNYPAKTTFIIGAGSAGEIGYSNVDFWAADDCYCFICADNYDSRFLYHYLLSKQEMLLSKVRKASIPRLARKDIASLQIPVPALPVQREIVRVLDSFTLYSAELTAELTARRKQYEFYRDKLLTFDTNIVWRKLEDIASFRRGSFPQPYTNESFYGGEGSMPFVQVADVADRGFRLVDKTKQTISKLAQPKSIFVKKGTVICSLQGSIGRVAIVQYDCYVDRTLAIFDSFRIEINKKYFAYAIDRKFSYEKEFARGSTIKTITKEEFSKFEIPVPPIEVQERIVKVLDNFDEICSDLKIGLPAEMEKRQQQYEYYREKLLDFNVNINKDINITGGNR